MRPGGRFRFQAFLDVYQTQEDALRGEIASLERDRRGVEQRIQTLRRACREAGTALSEGGGGDRMEVLVRYVEGLHFWMRQAASRRKVLGETIQEKVESLRSLRTERLRFRRLKERYQERLQAREKRIERKVTDEFAQRKIGH